MPSDFYLHDGSSGPLSRRSDSFGELSPNGQIDWGSLAKNMTHGAIGIFSRFSAAGVDPYTVFVGQALAHQFELSREGRHRIMKTFESLRSFKLLGQALEVGFGVRSFIRTLATTEEGSLLASLSAALSECFKEDITAEVLLEITQHSHAPEDMRPSILQWKNLVHGCTGIWASTEFPSLAEDYISLIQSHVPYPDCGSKSGDRCCASPKSIAEALVGIAQLSKGSYTSITIIGGPTAGWLVAFAEWLFDISVEIVNTNGETIVKSNRSRRARRLLVVIDREDEDSHVALTDKTYRLQSIFNVMGAKFSGPDV